MQATNTPEHAPKFETFWGKVIFKKLIFNARLSSNSTCQFRVLPFKMDLQGVPHLGVLFDCIVLWNNLLQSISRVSAIALGWILLHFNVPRSSPHNKDLIRTPYCDVPGSVRRGGLTLQPRKDELVCIQFLEISSLSLQQYQLKSIQATRCIITRWGYTNPSTHIHASGPWCWS